MFVLEYRLAIGRLSFEWYDLSLAEAIPAVTLPFTTASHGWMLSDCINLLTMCYTASGIGAVPSHSPS